MKKMRLFFVLLTSFLLATGPSSALARPSAPTAMLVWTEHIAHKVQPTTAAGSSTSLALEGARRSYESAQVVVTAQGAALSNVNLTAGPLGDGKGHSLPAGSFTFFREGFTNFSGVSESEPGSLPVPQNSPTADPWMPDALVPFIDPYNGTPAGAPFAIVANRNQPVWVDIYIPEDTLAGTYSGQITVSAAGQASVNVPVQLTVWKLVLPDKDSLTPYFQSNLDDIILYHRNTFACSGSNCWLDWGSAQAHTVIKRYEMLAHDHRIDIGQEFIPEPEAASRCAVPTDWSAYDAALQPYMDGSYWGDGIPDTWIRTPFSPGVTWGLETCSQAQYTALAAAWAAHLKAKGWFSRAVVYAYDEPPTSAYAAIAKNSSWMQAGDPDWKGNIMDTTAPAPSNVGVLNPALGIYTVCLRCYDHWYQDQPEYGRLEWPGLFSQGIRLWFYESNAQSDPYPTFATNTLLGVEPRMVLWGSWYEGATGFLLWDTVAWTLNNPWGPNVGFGKSGDGVLIYPGNHDGQLSPAGSPSGVAIDGPIPSYRLKMIRQGLQDWALFKLAEQDGLSTYAHQQVGRAYGQLGGCTWSGCPGPVNGAFFWLTDAVLMDSIRHNIAMAISANQAPDLPSNPVPPDGATDVFTNVILAWQGGDPDGDPITNTVRLGVSNPPPVAATVSGGSYTPSLSAGTHYYWQIQASDGISHTLSPVWQFTTGARVAQHVYLPLIR